MRIGIAQISSKLGLIKKNFEKHIEYAKNGEKEGLSLILFPELSLTGYLLEDASKDVAITKEEMLHLFDDTELSDIDLLIGYAEKTDSAVFNSQALISIKKGIPHLVVNQRKINLPTYGMFDESRHFRQGSELNFFTITRQNLKSVILICEDLWHPLLPASLSIEMPVPSIIFAPAASPSRGFSEDRKPSNLLGWGNNIKFWAQTLGSYVFNAQKVGVEDSFIFSGGSAIIFPDGTTIEAPLFEESLIFADIDINLIRAARQKTLPASFHDREILKKVMRGE